MNILLIILILTLCISVVMSKFFTVKTIRSRSQNSKDPKYGRPNDDKIFEGSYVNDMKKYAYMVSIKIHTSHICGGGLLTLNFVVTACHCLAKIPEDYPGPAEPFDMLRLPAYTFVVGTKNIEDYDDSAQIGRAESVYYHPECQNSRSLIYDHALAKMHHPFTRTPYVQPLKMYTWDKQEFRKLFMEMFSEGNGPTCEVAGWGDTRAGINNPELASDRLKSVQMRVLSEEDCSKTWVFLNPSVFKGFNFWKYGEICTLSDLEGSDCAGDSGSPYTCDGYLIATVSFGAEDCGEGDPSVYATVAELLDWINKDFAGEIGKTISSSPAIAVENSKSLLPRPISSSSTNILIERPARRRESRDQQKTSMNSNQESLSLNVTPALIVILMRLAFEK